ncbi:YraN family protein [Methanothermococcus okinawensis]|uniref:Restriction endonuclease type IV Mrr domain-containing protein n=1 Tax=Methanothermococcus okinawensis (strain DSM 14208 / JCM 11175 / IH1) TaxID=647113 RepID=F8ALV5_METOI|nr:YraN family protein [Methanothermococcus okinawensis]AEH07476.1 hypothetical protein Metok_1513 [Methanothermococcus okinawensis IH1]
MAKRKGSKKETIVAKKLKKSGHKILERNSVKRLNQHKKAEYDIITKRGNKKYSIEVKSGKQILTSTAVEKHIKKSNKIRAKAVFYVSKRVKFTKPAQELAKKNGVKIIRD